MYRFTSRAARWPLALIVTTLTALGACADEQRPITAPAAQPNKPSLAVGDVITVTNAKGGTDPGTLRWAVTQATGGEIIRFDARLAGSTITLDSTLVINKQLTIEGPADRGITISGGGKGRVIDVAATDPTQPATTLRNLSITGGKLTIEGGAGIRASSALRLEHTTVWGNEAGGPPAILTIVGYGRLTLVNSTVSGNTSTAGYQAIFAGEDATLINSTVAYNSGGGIHFSEFQGGVLQSSIIANNGVNNNCFNTEGVMYAGTSLSNDLTCGDSTVMLIGDAKLEALRDNGGPSMTHAVTPVSPAFNALPGGCSVAVDQRYKPRDAYCDIGAFESTDSTITTITIERVASVTPTGSSAFVKGTVKCSRNGDQFGVLVQVQQKGPDKTVVSGSGTVNVTCTTTAQPWSVVILPSAGAFKNGNAAASAATQQTPSWVAPGAASRSIKLVVPTI